ncbi:uncharacterized protein BO66DRAFT_437332 [Aspergillus aculeatinus CBS 121060]|uniref:Uncharacterized protein n=1 Tax=Aspergillus aculeatinus CBS 121060 TaxID=1448322 RepID=A0ACD1HCN8_9EURO|nr:hypothetical protein BO66DRAFT_437332 [Aspergillus aculeatinus CBS 121060]RAH71308.1 hypothetical protein BO66DRAFT_437332 [Aspergillus aculeatinus CBS 121060]
MLYQKGATVYIAGRSKPHAQAATQAIRASTTTTGGQLYYLPLHLDDENNGAYVIPWGRLPPGMALYLARHLAPVEESGTGRASGFWKCAWASQWSDYEAGAKGRTFVVDCVRG